jgi:hypothetical protein
MTWTLLLAEKKVAQEPTGKAELDDLRSIVERSLSDVKAPGLSADAPGAMPAALGGHGIAAMPAQSSGHATRPRSFAHRLFPHTNGVNRWHGFGAGRLGPGRSC